MTCLASFGTFLMFDCTEHELKHRDEEIASLKVQLRQVQEKAVDEWMFDGQSDLI